MEYFMPSISNLTTAITRASRQEGCVLAGSAPKARYMLLTKQDLPVSFAPRMIVVSGWKLIFLAAFWAYDSSIISLNTKFLMLLFSQVSNELPVIAVHRTPLGSLP